MNHWCFYSHCVQTLILNYKTVFLRCEIVEHRQQIVSCVCVWMVVCGYRQSIVVGYQRTEKMSKLEKYRVSYFISLNLSAPQCDGGGLSC
jgi:hypothetical protein